MNCDQILAALNRGPRLDGFHPLIMECNSRREEIRARVAEIRDGANPPRARLLAQRTSADAVRALDREIETLNDELSQLDRAEMFINEAWEAARAAKAREEIPGAKRRLPKLAGKVREALAALDASLASLRETVETVSEYPLAQLPFPLDDDELAELLELRAEMWRLRTVAVLIAPAMGENPGQWPRSWPLSFERRGDVVHPRSPGPWLPDLLGGDHPKISGRYK